MSEILRRKKISRTLKKLYRKGDRTVHENFYNAWLGKKRSKKDRKKMSEAANRYYRNGGKPKGMFGKEHTAETRKILSEKSKGNKYYQLAYKRILREIPKLEKQGYRCVPIGRVIPDIVAIKKGKVYAIEIERSKPNYKKYTREIKSWYDDVIWIIKNVRNYTNKR